MIRHKRMSNSHRKPLRTCVWVCVCVSSGQQSRSNLCVSGCLLCLCHSASHVEFTAPFGTAKKGKAAQVRELQPIAADPSSCLRPSCRWHAAQHTSSGRMKCVSQETRSLSPLLNLQRRDWRNDASVSEEDKLNAIKENESFGRCFYPKRLTLHSRC